MGRLAAANWKLKQSRLRLAPGRPERSSTQRDSLECKNNAEADQDSTIRSTLGAAESTLYLLRTNDMRLVTLVYALPYARQSVKTVGDVPVTVGGGNGCWFKLNPCALTAPACLLSKVSVLC